MLLIEKFPTESPKDVQVFLEALIVEIYGRRPEWMEYELRETYCFRGREFIRMHCSAGSFHGRLTLRASTGDGVSRDFLMVGLHLMMEAGEGHPIGSLLHRGRQSDFDPNEIEKIT